MFKVNPSPPPSESLEKPFGWEVTVTYRKLCEIVKETYHYRGCTRAAAQRKARLKAVFKTHASQVEILKTEPLSEAQWIRCYGLGRM